MQLRDIAIPMDELVSVRPKETLNALMATTTTNVGCCIVAEGGDILGILTDGDLRRAISANQSDAVAVKDAMKRANPGFNSSFAKSLHRRGTCTF